ncbi:MAG TPA: chemotaxis protein CheW [Coriobacteriia bacterium]|nr:chemotaxis protein CheW [Coriobacteriia bacterium]
MSPHEELKQDGGIASEGQCLLIDQVVVFQVDGQRYALPIENVQEIQQIVAFSEVPGGGAGVLGMLNLRGQVIPAVEVRVLLGSAPGEHRLETPMVICRIDGDLVALVVDEVEDVLGVPAGCVQEPPAMHGLASKMLGVARLDDGLVYILDPGVLLVGTGVLS